MVMFRHFPLRVHGLGDENIRTPEVGGEMMKGKPERIDVGTCAIYMDPFNTKEGFGKGITCCSSEISMFFPSQDILLHLGVLRSSRHCSRAVACHGDFPPSTSGVDIGRADGSPGGDDRPGADDRPGGHHGSGNGGAGGRGGFADAARRLGCQGHDGR